MAAGRRRRPNRAGEGEVALDGRDGEPFGRHPSLESLDGTCQVPGDTLPDAAHAIAMWCGVGWGLEGEAKVRPLGCRHRLAPTYPLNSTPRYKLATRSSKVCLNSKPNDFIISASNILDDTESQL